MNCKHIKGNTAYKQAAYCNSETTTYANRNGSTYTEVKNIFAVLRFG